MGIVSLWYQNSSYTDGRYNCNDFKVEMGTLDNKKAYKVYPPLQKFTQFLGSQHALIYKFTDKSDYTVYTFEDNALEIVEEVKSNKL